MIEICIIFFNKFSGERFQNIGMIISFRISDLLFFLNKIVMLHNKTLVF